MQKDDMTTLSKPRRISPLWVLFLGILAVSTASILIRFAQKEASSLVIAAYRLFFAWLFLLPLAIRKHRHEFAQIARQQWLWILLSGIFLAFHFAAWITSLEFTSVATSVVLVTTTPLWVGLFSPLVLRERLSRALLIGLLIALSGGMLVGMSGSCSLTAQGLVCPSMSIFFSGNSFVGNILALAGAVFAAAYLLAGRKVRANLSLVPYITMVYGVSAITLIGMAAFSGQRFVGFSTTTYLMLLGLAVIPQLFGHSAFNYALRYVSAAVVSVALLGEPIGSTILAMILLKETPTNLELAGGVLILIGITLATRAKVEE